MSDSGHRTGGAETEDLGIPTLIPDNQFGTLPPLLWLIYQVLPLAILVVLVGESGAGKTFLAIDWAYSVATGIPWHGAEVVQGTVVYLTVEGYYGFPERTQGWKLFHGVDVHNVVPVYLQRDQLQLGAERMVAALLDAIERENLRPVLIVVDPLIDFLVPGDENAARDIGLFVRGVREIHKRTGAVVLVLHHTGKSGGNERGSSAIRGASDALLKLRRGQDGTLTLTCAKMKNGRPFRPITLRLEEVRLDDDTGTCVILPHGPDKSTDPLSVRRNLTGSATAVLDALKTTFREQGASQAELVSTTGLGKRTVERAIEDLRAEKAITSSGTHKNTRYRAVSATNDEEIG